jgi:hypothetical protein
MKFADDIADNARAFLEAGRRVQSQFPHCVEEAAMDWFQTVADVGQGAGDDGRQSVGKVALA